MAQDKLQFYLENLGLQSFQKEPATFQSLLQGLGQAVTAPNLAKNCWPLLSSTAEKIFQLLPGQVHV